MFCHLQRRLLTAAFVYCFAASWQGRNSALDLHKHTRPQTHTHTPVARGSDINARNEHVNEYVFSKGRAGERETNRIWEGWTLWDDEAKRTETESCIRLALLPKEGLRSREWHGIGMASRKSYYVAEKKGLNCLERNHGWVAEVIVRKWIRRGSWPEEARLIGETRKETEPEWMDIIKIFYWSNFYGGVKRHQVTYLSLYSIHKLEHNLLRQRIFSYDEVIKMIKRRKWTKTGNHLRFLLAEGKLPNLKSDKITSSIKTQSRFLQAKSYERLSGN